MVTNKNSPIIFWSLWVAFCISFIAYQIFIPGSIFSAKEKAAELVGFSQQDYIIAGFCLVAIFVATIIRWLVLTKIKNPEMLLQTFIIALAFSEGPVFAAMFIITSGNATGKTVITALSFLSVLQMAPIFLKQDDSEI